MIELMIISGFVLLISITSSKLLYKFGVPILLVFIILGMLFGSDGIVGIYFSDYRLTKELSSIALVLIMFYGGFGTNWNMAKPSAMPSILMSTLGVLITAILTGLFTHWILGTTLLEGLLIGSIVASTDAASVFAILRSQKLNLEGSLASLLEVESGSNDPFAYMLTLAILTLMENGSLSNLTILLIKQIIFGIVVGILLAKVSIYLIKKLNFEIKGFYAIFITAIAILSYALSEYIGGNGYLSVYMCGIIIGNSKIPYKKSLFKFLDCISWIMQIALFFILGLLSFPSKLINIIRISIPISIFMIFIARPLATFIVLHKFKYSLKEKIFISWVGLRGAASIVFAIYAITYGVFIKSDIFHVVFSVALLSVAIQGTLLPKIAKKLDLVDENTRVLKTFNDYSGDIDKKIIEVAITEKNTCVNKSISDAEIGDDILIIMIKRKGDTILPKGSTIIQNGDILILTGEDIVNFNEKSL
ncbi:MULTISPECIES: potassium/proton antiporter [unclassified Romboutsia]|uniref:potassium/proton antiporter n=1 Tax=unclassified Romboutsia TaxID=2626894 RepID=UPI000820D3C8|nr:MULTISPECIES: potassium/proton antiporter [unclassified Romboutsia]SCI43554.1 potassium/proton antiporter [uncultured Clostridium sp.]